MLLLMYLCILCPPGGEGRAKGDVAVWTPDPRVLPHCPGSNRMQEKWLASGPFHAVHRGHSVPQ